MTSRSPTRDGFHAMFHRPSAGFIEVLWRWTFGAVFLLLLSFCVLAYLQSLPVTRAQMFFLGSGQTALVLQTLQKILQGSAPRLVRAFVTLLFTSTLGWIILASFGRAATLKILLSDGVLDGSWDKRKLRLNSIVLLHCFRAAALWVAAILSAAAFFMLSMAGGDNASLPGATLLALLLITVIWLAWGILNWFLAVAAIFVALEDCNAPSAVTRAIELCTSRLSGTLAVSIWFGLTRIAALYAMGLFGLLLIGVAPVISAAMLAATMAALLGYFLMADFLYIGRLSAYISLAKNPPDAAYLAVSSAQDEPRLQGGISAGMDPSELILSDIPLSPS